MAAKDTKTAFWASSTVGRGSSWKGLVNESVPIEERVMELTPVTVSGILTKGGTILYSSRTNPLSQENGLEDLRHNFDELGLN